jgi:hypothetical protein
MSMWQFLAALEGFQNANDPDADKALSTQERDELWDWIKG